MWQAIDWIPQDSKQLMIRRRHFIGLQKESFQAKERV